MTLMKLLENDGGATGDVEPFYDDENRPHNECGESVCLGALAFEIARNELVRASGIWNHSSGKKDCRA
jgi:hypothetical protein